MDEEAGIDGAQPGQTRGGGHAATHVTDRGEVSVALQVLEHRYAISVVLTFGQIEDLLGFTLPDLARTDQEWWTTPDLITAEAQYSDAWTLASRTAKPNLMAQTVLFERVS